MAKFGGSPAKQGRALIQQFWSDFSEILNLGSTHEKHFLEPHAPMIFRVAKTPNVEVKGSIRGYCFFVGGNRRKEKKRKKEWLSDTLHNDRTMYLFIQN